MSLWWRPLVRGALDALKRPWSRREANRHRARPGSVRYPIVARKLALSNRYEALIALGAVIRGQTPHFDYVAGECAGGIARIALECGVPIAFGVLTTDTVEQAIDRAGGKAGNKGADAALVALEMANLCAAGQLNGFGASAHRARSLARRLALQALYQIQLNPLPWQDIQKQFADDPEAERVDREYFRGLIEAIRAQPRGRWICGCRDCPRSRRRNWIRSSTPSCGWDCMNSSRIRSCLTAWRCRGRAADKQFGATDGYKFVNAVLDRAAQESRPHEYGT